MVITQLGFVLILAGACALPLSAATSVLTNGDFETVAEGWYPAWTRGDPGLVHPAQEEGTRFVRFALADHAAAMIHQSVPLDPQWRELTITAKARGTEVVPAADEAWKTARLLYVFKNDADELLGGYPDIRVQVGMVGWQALKAVREIPAGATRVEITIGSWGAKGTIDFDDVTVTPTRISEIPPGADAGPALLVPELERFGPRREQLLLTGEWRFLPGTGSAAREPTATGWGLIRVPGSWHDAVTHRGSGDAWRLFQPMTTNKAWYQCEVEIPATWRGRAVELLFDRVSTDARIFVNGVDAGAVRWPWGVVELQDHLRFGERNRILVSVISVNDRSTVTQFMGYADEPTAPATLDSRGIIGEVALRSRPAGAHLHDLAIRPSVRAQALDLDLELRGLGSGDIAVEADLRGPDGTVEKAFRTQITIDQGGDQDVTVRFPWRDPRLWEIGKPETYTLDLRLRGAGLDDTAQRVFGFREFWIEGRDFYLNGHVVRLRPFSVDYGRGLAGMLEKGYNFAHHWPKDQVRRGTLSDYDARTIAEADTMGLLCAANVAHMRWYVDNERWNSPEAQAEYQHILAQQVRRYRRHPSVVMYTHSANAFPWQGDGDPWTLGRSGISHQQERQRHAERVAALTQRIKALDPKPVYTHFGSEIGEVHTSNLYLNFLPLQEREEWISAWAIDGDRPFGACEFGTPLYSSVMRGRAGYSHQGHSEPFPSEWSASHLGAAAYALEKPDLRAVMAKRFKLGDLHKEYEPHIRWDKMEQVVIHGTAYARVMDDFMVQTWRSWRSQGISFGMVPWHATDDSPALLSVNGPTLAWIAGPGGLPTPEHGAEEPLTAKTHHYRPGQTLRKQIILINDARQAVDYAGTVRITVDGRTLQERDVVGTLAISEQRGIPIEQVLDEATGAGEIRLRIRVGTQEHMHDVAFQVLAPPAPVRLRLSAFDPAGDTTAYLRGLGCEVLPWEAGAPATPVAVIGRGALAAGHQIPAPIADWVAGGGRLLVMGQDRAWLHHALHLRTAEYASRRVFAIDPRHPVLAGLEPANLHEWNGSGTLREAYPRFTGFEMVPPTGWRWGNRHSVTSAPIEKPHRGAWRPLLECEFDLAYSPLLEMDHGRGRVTLCTLDLEARTARDPAADRLAVQLLRHVEQGAVTARRPTVYIGAEAGLQRLRDLGVQVEVVQQLPDPGALLILGAGASVPDDALRSFLGAGGQAVALRREADQSVLGVRLERREAFGGSLERPTWPQTLGIGGGDLRWRGDAAAWLVAAQDGVERAADGQLGRIAVGKGVIIFAQVGPDAVPADTQRYFRFSRWRQTRALCQVLTNLGASFAQDRRFLDLLHAPDHYLDLSGEGWLARNTIRLVESPDRQWHALQPMSATAQALVADQADVSAMQAVPVPAYLESYPGWGWIDGETVFRREFTWPAHAAGKRVFVSLGRVDEHEISFLNGQEIGRSKHWLLPRGHVADGALVRAGRNVLAIRNWDEGIHGGLCPAPGHLHIRVLGEDPGFYHPDYLDHGVSTGITEAEWQARAEQWKIADDPYRYYRW